MKIVDVAEHYAPEGGGVKTYIHNKLAAAASHGHEMIVIAPGKVDKIERKNGGTIYWMKNPRLRLDKRYGVFRNQKALHQLLTELEPDVIEGGSIWAGGRMVSRWQGKAKKALIFHQDFTAAYGHSLLDKFMTTHTIDKLFTPWWSYIRKMAMRYDSTIVAGQWLSDRLNQFDISNTQTIPFGMDKSFFSPTKKCPDRRIELLKLCGRDTDATLLLCVSRFHPEKRLRTLFEAVRILNKQKPHALIVFGEGILSKSDRKYAAETPGVCLAGFTSNREEIASAYASSDIYLHGSAAETFGLSIAEAICSGLPVVAPDMGGAADLVQNPFGNLYQAGNAKDCARAIEKAQNISKKEWKKHTQERTLFIKKTDEHFKNLFNYYEKLISNSY